MSRLNRSERAWLAVLISAGAVLGGCTASKPTEPEPYPMPSSSVPSRPGAPGGVAPRDAGDDARSGAMDAAIERATVADPGAGSRFTECVNGRPVTLGSTTESGGTSPDI